MQSQVVGLPATQQCSEERPFQNVAHAKTYYNIQRTLFATCQQKQQLPQQHQQPLLLPQPQHQQLSQLGTQLQTEEDSIVKVSNLYLGQDCFIENLSNSRSASLSNSTPSASTIGVNVPRSATTTIITGSMNQNFNQTSNLSKHNIPETTITKTLSNQEEIPSPQTDAMIGNKIPSTQYYPNQIIKPESLAGESATSLCGEDHLISSVKQSNARKINPNGITTPTHLIDINEFQVTPYTNTLSVMTTSSFPQQLQSLNPSSDFFPLPTLPILLPSSLTQQSQQQNIQQQLPSKKSSNPSRPPLRSKYPSSFWSTGKRSHTRNILRISQSFAQLQPITRQPMPLRSSSLGSCNNVNPTTTTPTTNFDARTYAKELGKCDILPTTQLPTTQPIRKPISILTESALAKKTTTLSRSQELYSHIMPISQLTPKAAAALFQEQQQCGFKDDTTETAMHPIASGTGTTTTTTPQESVKVHDLITNSLHNNLGTSSTQSGYNQVTLFRSINAANPSSNYPSSYVSPLDSSLATAATRTPAVGQSPPGKSNYFSKNTQYDSTQSVHNTSQTNNNNLTSSINPMSHYSTLNNSNHHAIQQEHKGNHIQSNEQSLPYYFYTSNTHNSNSHPVKQIASTAKTRAKFNSSSMNSSMHAGSSGNSSRNQASRESNNINHPNRSKSPNENSNSFYQSNQTAIAQNLPCRDGTKPVQQSVHQQRRRINSTTDTSQFAERHFQRIREFNAASRSAKLAMLGLPASEFEQSSINSQVLNQQHAMTTTAATAKNNNYFPSIEESQNQFDDMYTYQSQPIHLINKYPSYNPNQNEHFQEFPSQEEAVYLNRNSEHHQFNITQESISQQQQVNLKLQEKLFLQKEQEAFQQQQQQQQQDQHQRELVLSEQSRKIEEKGQTSTKQKKGSELNLYEIYSHSDVYYSEQAEETPSNGVKNNPHKVDSPFMSLPSSTKHKINNLDITVTPSPALQNKIRQHHSRLPNSSNCHHPGNFPQITLPFTQTNPMSIPSDRLHTSFSKHPFPTSTNELESEIVQQKLNEEPCHQTSIKKSNYPSPNSQKSKKNNAKKQRTPAPSTIYIDMSSINSSAAQQHSEDNLEESHKTNSESQNHPNRSSSTNQQNKNNNSNPYSQQQPEEQISHFSLNEIVYFDQQPQKKINTHQINETTFGKHLPSKNIEGENRYYSTTTTQTATATAKFSSPIITATTASTTTTAQPYSKLPISQSSQQPYHSQNNQDSVGVAATVQKQSIGLLPITFSGCNEPREKEYQFGIEKFDFEDDSINSKDGREGGEIGENNSDDHLNSYSNSNSFSAFFSDDFSVQLMKKSRPSRVPSLNLSRPSIQVSESAQPKPAPAATFQDSLGFTSNPIAFNPQWQHTPTNSQQQQEQQTAFTYINQQLIQPQQQQLFKHEQQMIQQRQEIQNERNKARNENQNKHQQQKGQIQVESIQEQKHCQEINLSEQLGIEMSISKALNKQLRDQVSVLEKRIEVLRRTPLRSSVLVPANNKRQVEENLRSQVSEIKASRKSMHTQANEEYCMEIASRAQAILASRNEAHLAKERRELSHLYSRKSSTEAFCKRLVDSHEANTLIEEQIRALQAQEAHLLKITPLKKPPTPLPDFLSHQHNPLRRNTFANI